MKLTLNEVKKSIKNFKTLKHDLELQIRNFVINEQYTLDERWGVFIEYCQIGEYDIDYSPKFDYILFSSIPMIGHGSVLNVDTILEINEDYDIFEGENIDTFKEYCLENFIYEIEIDIYG